MLYGPRYPFLRQRTVTTRKGGNHCVLTDHWQVASQIEAPLIFRKRLFEASYMCIHGPTVQGGNSGEGIQATAALDGCNGVPTASHIHQQRAV